MRVRHFPSTTRRGARMRRYTLILEWSANTLLLCSDLNGAQHEQPSALHPILQPRHTADFLAVRALMRRSAEFNHGQSGS